MPSAVSPDAELGLKLALAVVGSSHAPVLLLDGNRAVIIASDAFCEAFDIDPATIVGKTFADLGDGEWAIALRCAQFHLAAPALATIPLTAYAGAGIVAGSDPEAEMLETRVKFRPIIDALA